MKKYYMIMAALIMTASCGNPNTATSGHEGHEHEEHEHEEAHSHHAHGAGMIEFTEAQAESAGLTTETVKPDVFHSIIRTSGEILPAQGDEKTVVATTSGIISLGGTHGTRILPGSRLAKGAALAVISARDMAEGDPVAKSRAVYESAAKEFERAEGLMKSNAISRKAYEQAKKDYEIARAEFDAYNGKSGERGLSVVSPLDGYVKQIYVNDGDYVNAGEPVASVTASRRLQLRADVPEKYYSRMKGIVSANFRPSYSDETYSVKDLGGKVISIGRTAASGSFYMPVIFEFDNRGNLIPGAFCEIYLVEGQRENVISVPETALVEEQGVYSVFLKVCDDEYRKQEVKTGDADGIRREIISGLKEGDEVVSAGAMQVKLASVKGSIPGHTHNH